MGPLKSYYIIFTTPPPPPPSYDLPSSPKKNDVADYKEINIQTPVAD